MAKNNKTTIFILLLLIIAMIFSILYFSRASVFPDKFGFENPSTFYTNQNGKQSFTEGDTIEINHKQGGIVEGRYSENCWGLEEASEFIEPSAGNLGWCGAYLWIDDKLVGYQTDNVLTAGEHYIESSYSVRSGLTILGRTEYDSRIINVKPLPCVLGSNQYLVEEIFKQGETYSKDSLTFDVVKFCSIHAPIIVSADTLTSNIDLTIITKLENNQEITVPSNTLHKITYVVDDPRANKCVDSSYNPELEICEDSRSLTGIIQLLKIDTETDEVTIVEVVDTIGDETLGVVDESEITPVEEITITPVGEETIVINNKETGEPKEITLKTTEESLPEETKKSFFNLRNILILLGVIIIIGIILFFVLNKKRRRRK